MKIKFSLENVQHINSCNFELDLGDPGLTCIVGRNGVGKTTLVKSVFNMKSADVFSKTSAPGIFKEGSLISYAVGENVYVYAYDSEINDLNSRSPVPNDLRALVEVELPMPHGQRFNDFQKIKSADIEIRTCVILGEYSEPKELIEFLADIYSSEKFKDLKEVTVGKDKFYILPLPGDRYVREDHFSSGEFFLISLYRTIKSRCKLIVIDEIDISLDAAAQAHLIKWLRVLCRKEEIRVVFTTHSLAIMRTLDEGELFYLEEIDGVTSISDVSYNYVKSRLFGFKGWDRYILTEDRMLVDFICYVVNRYCPDLFCKYRVIPIGGSENVVRLMIENSSQNFLSYEKDVISVLDGDQSKTRIGRKRSVICIPFQSIEKDIYDHFIKGAFLPGFQFESAAQKYSDKTKDFYKALQRQNIKDSEIFDYLCNYKEKEVAEFADILKRFLSKN
ncbi:cobalamin ABC transporter ATPase [Pseudomonas oryzihabitans]|nr:cobalamin ABC transporter ATPase [Pseudomonas psychrotolerans]